MCKAPIAMAQALAIFTVFGMIVAVVSGITGFRYGGVIVGVAAGLTPCTFFYLNGTLRRNKG